MNLRWIVRLTLPSRTTCFLWSHLSDIWIAVVEKFYCTCVCILVILCHTCVFRCTMNKELQYVYSYFRLFNDVSNVFRAFMLYVISDFKFFISYGLHAITVWWWWFSLINPTFWINLILINFLNRFSEICQFRKNCFVWSKPKMEQIILSELIN